MKRLAVLFEYPVSMVWLSLLTTGLVIITLLGQGSRTETHIDNTISLTLSHVLDQKGAANAKAVKDLHDALNKAVAGFIQECHQLEALGQKCPELLIQLPPGE